jgi:hypothetical protein
MGPRGPQDTSDSLDMIFRISIPAIYFVSIYFQIKYFVIRSHVHLW